MALDTLVAYHESVQLVYILALVAMYTLAINPIYSFNPFVYN